MSQDQLNALVEKILEHLGEGGGGKDSSPQQNKKISLTPSQILVLAGILGGVFKVHSLLLFQDQSFELRLSGSLKRKTKIDKFLDSIGSMSFDEVVRAFIGHFS